MSDTVKLIIEIPEPIYDRIKYLEPNADTMLDKLMRVVQNGIPLDDVKAEVFRQSEQNNENFSHDWNEGFNDGMFHTLTIIGDYFMHIGKAESEEE